MSTDNEFKELLNLQVENEKTYTNKFLDISISLYTAITSALVYLPYNTNFIVDNIYQSRLYVLSLLCSGIIVLTGLLIKFLYIGYHVDLQKDIIKKRNQSIKEGKVIKAIEISKWRNLLLSLLPGVHMIAICFQIIFIIGFALVKLNL